MNQVALSDNAGLIPTYICLCEKPKVH